MSDYDWIQDAKSIAAQLAAAGRSRESDSIVSAIRAGSTGTEIAMAVRYQLQQLELSKLDADAKLEAQCQELEAFLGELLA